MFFWRKKKTRGPPPPPDSPDDPSRLPPEYRAPDDDRVWDWIKTAPIDYFVEAWSEMDPEGFEDFRLWPQGQPVKAATKIRRHILELILQASKEQYPNEFGGLLRAEKGVIEELVLLPGTISGDSSAIFQF
ncbi:MAG: hypothetical protein KY455_02115, partial [Euryarchaeota archaeon]|nr:hypothetical protein [Euryarchaeota archaeon]